MPQHEPPQMSKLLHGEVGRERCLPPLAPFDADANMGSLDHPNVISSITDCCSARLCMLSNEAHDLRLPTPERERRGRRK